MCNPGVCVVDLILCMVYICISGTEVRHSARLKKNNALPSHRKQTKCTFQDLKNNA